MDRFVLDSYAILAFLEGAEGADRVVGLLEDAMEGRCELSMSVVNLGEVVYITERERGLPKAQEVLGRIDEMPIQVVDADRAQMLIAAHIKARWPIAYADCFAAALAQLKEASLVTGDPEFLRLDAASVVQVAWLVDTLPKGVSDP